MKTEEILTPGWWPCGGKDYLFRSLTTKKKRGKPGPTPRGLREASPGALRRWEADNWAQAPYQHAKRNC
eukprot:9952508-Heterocapsa_arctica.AAC.1